MVPEKYESVKASDLEAILENGVMMYGKTNSDGFDSHDFADDRCMADTDTHIGLLINIQPIEKQNPVSKKEVINFLQEHSNAHFSLMNNFIKRIESAGIE